MDPSTKTSPGAGGPGVLAQEKDRASPVTRAAAWKRNMVSVYSLALNELNPSRGGSATPAFGA